MVGLWANPEEIKVQPATRTPPASTSARLAPDDSRCVGSTAKRRKPRAMWHAMGSDPGRAREPDTRAQEAGATRESAMDEAQETLACRCLAR
mmetsp:Transcript_19872/g.58042  ORF Transcript_19872/g.58042 Transcript_19872/m.58042 type:complete len:92 (-) Transcript_19872:58-333(-)